MASVINFDEDSVQNAISVVTMRYANGIESMADIIRVTTPLREGLWIGEAANAFFLSTDDYLKFAQRVNDGFERLNGNLQRVMNLNLETIEKIRDIINS